MSDNHGNSSLLAANEAYFGQGVFVAVPVYLLCVGMAGTFLNSMVLMVFACQKSLRTPMNMLFLSIAISDFGQGVFGGLWQCIMTLERVEAEAGTTLCDVYGFTVYFVGMASLYNLTGVAFFRYITVTDHRLVTSPSQVAKIVIVTAWLCAFIWAVLPFIPSLARFVPEGLGTWCSVDFAHRPHRPYIVSLFIIGFVLPIIVIVYCYIGVILAIKKVAATNAGQASSAAKAERRVTVMVILMVGCFLLAWTPYALFALVMVFGTTSPPLYSGTLPSLLAKSSCIYNPLIYVSVNKQFRTGLRKMLRRGRTTPVTTGPILGRPTGDSMVTIHRGNSVHPGNTSTQHGAKAEHVTSAKPHTSIAVAPAHNTAGRP